MMRVYPNASKTGLTLVIPIWFHQSSNPILNPKLIVNHTLHPTLQSTISLVLAGTYIYYTLLTVYIYGNSQSCRTLSDTSSECLVN